MTDNPSHWGNYVTADTWPRTRGCAVSQAPGPGAASSAISAPPSSSIPLPSWISGRFSCPGNHQKGDEEPPGFAGVAWREGDTGDPGEY